MTIIPGSGPDFAAVLRRVDAALSEGQYDRDARLAGLLSCKLLQAVSTQLGADQLAAWAVARSFWNGSESEDARPAVECGNAGLFNGARCMKVKHVWNIAVRETVALATAALITGAGVWAFMANIHDQQMRLTFLVAVSMPFAALASQWGFLGSDAVYWASLIAGFSTWYCAAYLAAGAVVRRI